MPATAVLFDLDDTLVDHRHCNRVGLAALQQRFAAEGLDEPALEELEQVYRTMIDDLHVRVLSGLMDLDEARVERFQRFLSIFLLDVPPRLARDAAGHYRDAYEAALRPTPGALEILNRLRGRARVAVVTNHIGPVQRNKVARCGFGPLIDALLISGEVGATKPDRAIFDAALQALSASPGAAVMVGDSRRSDIVGARQAGVRAVWLNRYGDPCPDPALARQLEGLEPVDEAMRVILEG